MVADPGAVAVLSGQHRLRRGHTANGGSRLDQCRDARLHIVRQIPAVRPGVSRELLVIEGLQVVQRLLGGVAQGAVGLPLEGGQIKKGGWLLRFLPPLHRLDHGGAALAPGGGLLRLFLAGLPVPGQGETVTVQLHHVERLRLERGDLRLPLDHQRQRGGDHAANVQSAAIEQGEQPGGVDAHQPVRLGPAEGGLMQPVILPSGAQMGKALPNGLVLHGGNPQPGDGLGAACQGIDRAENQLPLAARVAGIDHLGHVLPPKEGPQYVKLVPLVLGDGKPPALRQDGQVLLPPLGVGRVIRGGVRQLRQMPHTPAHQPAVSFQIPLPALSSPQHGGQTLGYRGLFRNYQLIQVCLTPFSSSIKRLHGLYNNDRILSRKYNWRFCYDYQAIHRSAE